MLLEKISSKKVVILDDKDKKQLKGGSTDILVEDTTIM